MMVRRILYRRNLQPSSVDSPCWRLTWTSSAGAAMNTTSYAYDVMGRVSEVTNALGNVTFIRYDLRGNRIHEGGATYPVDYAYDVHGNRTSMTTYRDESSGSGDTTTWNYDEASGLVTNKVYADGQGPTYAYDAQGRLTRRTWARGVTTDYAYDGWGNMTNTVYSDGTPTITIVYDVMGRRTSVTDAAGTTSFAYDDYGSVTNEVWGGLGGRVLSRHWDRYGRNVGYSVDGVRRTELGHDSATGRIVTMDADGMFSWQYLPWTHLKSGVAYPNGVAVDYTYEPNRDLLTGVRNHRGDVDYSEYLYANDAIGRRTSRNGESYGYNSRNELTSAIGNGAYAYQYDDIGNREIASELGTNSTYAVNGLNQYTLIGVGIPVAAQTEFMPQYDVDGNQTLVKTSTGIWQVTYNGENRPIRWTRGDSVVTMDFDSMGRRCFCRETENGEQVAFARFFYDGHLMIQQLQPDSPYGVVKEFIWDPTESVATKPLCFREGGKDSAFLVHDGNKNVTDVIRVSPYNDSVAHYDYSPFWGVRSQSGARASDNPFRFSSEFFDDSLGLVYYNYRHYEPMIGRWMCREPLGEAAVVLLYGFLGNVPAEHWDRYGLASCQWNTIKPGIGHFKITAMLDSLTPLDLLDEPYREILINDVNDFIREIKGISKAEYLSHCPCCLKDAHEYDGWSKPEKTRHVGGDLEVRRKLGVTGGGQQCVYDSRGQLINVGPAAGTPDQVHPGNNYETILHAVVDGWPYATTHWIDLLARKLELDSDIATQVDHWWNEPDKGMGLGGDPCPLNKGNP